MRIAIVSGNHTASAEKPAQSTRTSTIAGARHERRGVQRDELERMRGNLAFGAKRPQSIEHEAVDHAGGIREHVRDGAAAARLAERQVVVRPVERREAHDEVGATDDDETCQRMTQTETRHASRSAFAPLRASIGRCEHGPRRLAHQESRPPPHFDGDPAYVLREDGEEHEQHAE